MELRPFHEEDRPAVRALGTPPIDWWHSQGQQFSLHLVAVVGGEVAGHVQAVDRSIPEPSRRPGQCHFSLDVAPALRRKGIGAAMYAQVEEFAKARGARALFTAYDESPSAAAAPFLAARGFEPLERFYPSTLDLTTFDSARFASAIDRVEVQGIRLCRYSGVDDTAANRRLLYDLEQAGKAIQPFREVEPYIAEPFDRWEAEFRRRDQSTIFIAIASPQAWAGVVTSLEWYFTATHPDWHGRGIATALKIMTINEAISRGLKTMETENHEDNHAMLAINRKLGFAFGASELACIKRLR